MKPEIQQILSVIRALEHPGYGDVVGDWVYAAISMVSSGESGVECGAWAHSSGVQVFLPVDGELVYDALERACPGSVRLDLGDKP